MPHASMARWVALFVVAAACFGIAGSALVASAERPESRAAANARLSHVDSGDFDTQASTRTDVNRKLLQAGGRGSLFGPGVSRVTSEKQPGGAQAPARVNEAKLPQGKAAQQPPQSAEQDARKAPPGVLSSPRPGGNRAATRTDSSTEEPMPEWPLLAHMLSFLRTGAAAEIPGQLPSMFLPPRSHPSVVRRSADAAWDAAVRAAMDPDAAARTRQDGSPQWAPQEAEDPRLCEGPTGCDGVNGPLRLSAALRAFDADEAARRAAESIEKEVVAARALRLAASMAFRPPSASPSSAAPPPPAAPAPAGGVPGAVPVRPPAAAVLATAASPLASPPVSAEVMQARKRAKVDAALDAVCGCSPEESVTTPELTALMPTIQAMQLQDVCAAERPFMVHDGRLDIGNMPVLVLGAGTGHLPLRLATTVWANNTIVSVTWLSSTPRLQPDGTVVTSEHDPDTLSPSDVHAAVRTHLGASNDWICDLPADASSGVIPLAQYLESAAMAGNSSFRFGAVVVPDFAALRGSELPHEYEEMFSHILRIARIVILPAALPEDVYFTYWATVEDLLAASAERADVVLTPRTLSLASKGGGATLSGLTTGVSIALVQQPWEATVEEQLYDAVDGRSTIAPSPIAAAVAAGVVRTSTVGGASNSAQPSKSSAAAAVTSRRDKCDTVTLAAATAADLGSPKVFPLAATLAAGVPLSLLLDLGLRPEDVSALSRQIISMNVPANPAWDTASASILCVGKNAVFASALCRDDRGGAPAVPAAAVPVPQAGKARLAANAQSSPVIPQRNDGSASIVGVAAAGRKPTLNGGKQPAAMPPAKPADIPAPVAAVDQQDADNSITESSAVEERPEDVVPVAGRWTRDKPSVQDVVENRDDNVVAPNARDAAQPAAPAKQHPAAEHAANTVLEEDEEQADAEPQQPVRPLLNRKTAAQRRSGGLFAPRDQPAVGRKLLQVGGNKGVSLRGAARSQSSLRIVSGFEAEAPAKQVAHQGTNTQRTMQNLLDRPVSWADMRPRARTRGASSRSSSKPGLLSDAARAAQAALVVSEEIEVRSWWAVLKTTSLLHIATQAKGAAILACGDHLGLLSVKLAKTARSSVVVTAHAESLELKTHEELLQLLGLSNNILATGAMTAARLNALTASPNAFWIGLWEADFASHLVNDAVSVLRDFQALAADSSRALLHGLAEAATFESVLQAAASSDRDDGLVDLIMQRWDARLRAMLLAAAHSVIHLPVFSRVLAGIRLLTSECPSYAPCSLGFHRTQLPVTGRAEAEAEESFAELRDAVRSAREARSAVPRPKFFNLTDRVLERLQYRLNALEAANTRPAGRIVRVINNGAGDSMPSRLLGEFGAYRVLLRSAIAAANRDGTHTVSFHVDVAQHGTLRSRMYAVVRPQSTAPAAAVIEPGVSLHALLALGVRATTRARLFRMFLSMPLAAIERDSANAAVAPWQVRLIPDVHAACSSRLRFVLPDASASTGFVSSVCFNHAADDDDTTTTPQLLNAAGGGAADGQASGPSFISHDTDGDEDDAGDADMHTRELWSALASQLIADDTATGGVAGKFSFVEYNSGMGHMSLLTARAFPNATVLSLEGDEAGTNAHLAAALRSMLHNNIIARTNVNAETFRRLYESPEFFRFQLLSGDFAGMLLRSGSALPELQTSLGSMFALAAASFLQMPSAVHVSLALTAFAEMYPDTAAWVLPALHSAQPSRLSRLAALALAGTDEAFTGMLAQHEHITDAWWRELPGTRYARVAVLPHAHASVATPCWSLWGHAWGSSDVCSGHGDDATFSPFVDHTLEELSPHFAITAHPRRALQNAEARLLSGLVRSPSREVPIRITAAPVPAQKALPVDMDSIKPATTPLSAVGLHDAWRLAAAGAATSVWLRPVLARVTSGLVRVDLLNLTRRVNHHFQSDLDGHTRKYTLRVSVNDTAGLLLTRAGVNSKVIGADAYRVLPAGNHPNHGHTLASTGLALPLQLAPGVSGAHVVRGVTSIILTRDTDGSLIPYDSVHGITLISILRLGLVPALRTRAYHQFVALPVFLDMAPWNIVFVGPRLDYIDYDTRDRSYDKYIVKMYEIMEAMMNYKRTVEDFKKCGPKGSNPYNFGLVSECVGEVASPVTSCKDSTAPVSCRDGTCQPNYVACLRSLSEKDRSEEVRQMLRWAFSEAAKASAEQEPGEVPQAAPPALSAPRTDAGDAFAQQQREDMERMFGDPTVNTKRSAAERAQSAPARSQQDARAAQALSYDNGGAMLPV